MPPRSGSSFLWIIIAAVGCLGLVFVIAIVAAIIVPALSAARGASRTVDCKNSLKQIGVYCNLYESKFHAWPPTLRSIWAILRK